ncbi:hypothetical protein I653_13675 [Bacillus subtilis subsp. subtilis str. BAB-1]|nr:hypothetical protein I653_13675 [Bacillus subtilis subsp. subtilis str. BAB-1]
MWPRYHPYFRQTDAVVSFIDITESDSGSPLRAVYAVPATTQEVKPISAALKMLSVSGIFSLESS